MSEQPVDNPRPGRVLSVIGIVLGFVGLIPVLFFLGLVGAAVGFVGYRKGDPKLGPVAIALPLVLFVVSVALNFWLLKETSPS